MRKKNMIVNGGRKHFFGGGEIKLVLCKLEDEGIVFISQEAGIMRLDALIILTGQVKRTVKFILKLHSVVYNIFY